MPVSDLRLIKRCREYLPIDDRKNVPPNTRGIYVLYQYRSRLDKYDVVYIGMAGGEVTGIRGRLDKHAKTKEWTHFSVFEVWDNIREEEIRELEGILRHIFRKDTRACKLAVHKSFKKLNKIHRESKKDWID